MNFLPLINEIEYNFMIVIPVFEEVEEKQDFSERERMWRDREIEIGLF